MKVPVMRSWLFAFTVATLLIHTHAGVAEDLPPRYRTVVDKGLEYLAKNQARDGHWEANGGQYPTTMTALGGMTMLMEGSTIREGKYAEQIRKAVDWLMDRGQPTACIGNPNNPTEAGRYMYGHGFGLLFLCLRLWRGGRRRSPQKLETDPDAGRRVQRQGQTPRGGWGYVSRAPTAAISTKARSPSRRCRPCGPPATPASWCPKESSTRPTNTSKTARPSGAA